MSNFKKEGESLFDHHTGQRSSQKKDPRPTIHERDNCQKHTKCPQGASINICYIDNYNLTFKVDFSHDWYASRFN